VLSQLNPPVAERDYNDDLDRWLLAYLGIAEGEVMTFRKYLVVVRGHLGRIEKVCTHLGEDEEDRIKRIRRGLERLAP